MYLVGIDISKYKHDCFILKETGEVVLNPFSISNNQDGFQSLLTVLNSLNPHEEIRIGFEATSHYSLNLKLFLEKAHHSFMEFNPLLLTKFNKSQTLRRTKTDAIDSISIARWLMTVDYKPYPVGFYHIYSLKSLTRLRDSLVKQRSFYIVKLTNVLDHTFPEFKPFFANRFSKTALYLLETYGSAENMAQMNPSSYENLRKISRGKFSMQKFIKLKELAANTVGADNEIFSLQLQSLLTLYNQCAKEVERLEEQIISLITNIQPKSMTIPGIGPLSAAVIYSEYGDIQKFHSPSAMLSFAGLEPVYYQSGTSEHAGRMVKHGSSKLPEEWEVIPNTHEGIVTQEEFDIVQQLITSRRLPQNKGGFVNIFAGVIKCVDCGCALRAMNVHRRKRPEIIDCVQYSCNNYARNGRSECSAHNIEARDLFNAVLADINCFADMAVNDEKAVRAIEKRLTETDQSRAKALEKERKKLNKRLAELDRLFSSLYEDKVMERITERNFEMMSGKYQKEQLEIEARLKEVTETLNESYEKSRGIRDFLALIRNYQGLKELDATVINALIDKILVSEREKMADGTVKQEIKIYYKFIGFVDELHIIPTKRWAAMPAKNCTVCGVEYVPGSGASRYCPACAKKIRREKSNESKRRSREQKRIACMNCPQKMTD